MLRGVTGRKLWVRIEKSSAKEVDPTTQLSKSVQLYVRTWDMSSPRAAMEGLDEELHKPGGR